MFVTTEVAREVGEAVGLEVIHPGTGAAFPIEGVSLGMGIEFTDMDEPARDAYWEFVLSGIPSLDDEHLAPLDDLSTGHAR